MQTAVPASAPSSLEQAYNMSGGKNALACQLCGRVGYPIMPLRNTYVSKAIASTANIATLETGIKSSVSDVVRSVRIMREGFLYVLIYQGSPGQAKKWINTLAYEVTPEGYFRRTNGCVRKDGPPEPIPAQCNYEGHGALASFIHIDEDYVDGNHTAYFAFANNSWAPSVSENYRNQLAKASILPAIKTRFQEVKLSDIFDNSTNLTSNLLVSSYLETLAKDSTTKASFYITPQNWNLLSEIVAEYAPVDRRENTPAAYPFYPKGGSRSHIENVQKFIQTTIATTKKPGVPALVLNDPIGDAIELNVLRNLLILEDKAWQAEKERYSRYHIATLIQSIEKDVVKMENDSGPGFFTPWRYLTYKGPSLKGIQQYYDSAQAKKTIETWNKTLTEYRKAVESIENTYVRNLNYGGLVSALEYDYTDDIEGGKIDDRKSATDYTLVVAQILYGGIYTPIIYADFKLGQNKNVTIKSESLLEYWKTLLTTNNSILYKSLFRRNKNLLNQFAQDFNAAGDFDTEQRLLEVVKLATSTDEEKDYWINNERIKADNYNVINSLWLATMSAATVLEGHIKQSGVTRLFQRTSVIYNDLIFRPVQGEISVQQFADEINNIENAKVFTNAIQDKYNIQAMGENLYTSYIDSVTNTVGKNTFKPVVWVVDLTRETKNYNILNAHLGRQASPGSYLLHNSVDDMKELSDVKLSSGIFTYTLKIGGNAAALYFTIRAFKDTNKKLATAIGADEAQLVLKFYSACVSLVGISLQGLGNTMKMSASLGQRITLLSSRPAVLSKLTTAGVYGRAIGILGEGINAIASTIDAFSTWCRYLDSVALKEPEAVQRMLLVSIVMYGISALLAIIAVVLVGVEMIIAAVVVGIISFLFSLAGSSFIFFAEKSQMTPLDRWLHRTCFSKRNPVKGLGGIADGVGGADINPKEPEFTAYIWADANSFPRTLLAYKALCQGLAPMVSITNETRSFEIMKLVGKCTYPVFEFYSLLPNYKKGASAYEVLFYVETIEGNQNPGSRDARLPSDRRRYSLYNYNNNVASGAPRMLKPNDLKDLEAPMEMQNYDNKLSLRPETMKPSSNPDDPAVFPVGGKYILNLENFTWKSFVGAVVKVRYWQDSKDIYNYCETDFIEIFCIENTRFRPMTFCPVDRKD